MVYSSNIQGRIPKTYFQHPALRHESASHQACLGFKADQTALDLFFEVVSPQSLKMLFNPDHSVVEIIGIDQSQSHMSDSMSGYFFQSK